MSNFYHPAVPKLLTVARLRGKLDGILDALRLKYARVEQTTLLLGQLDGFAEDLYNALIAELEPKPACLIRSMDDPSRYNDLIDALAKSGAPAAPEAPAVPQAPEAPKAAPAAPPAAPEAPPEAPAAPAVPEARRPMSTKLTADRLKEDFLLGEVRNFHDALEMAIESHGANAVAALIGVRTQELGSSAKGNRISKQVQDFITKLLPKRGKQEE